jgi:23S rRNA (adenine1618-N6)-methyltransferase
MKRIIKAKTLHKRNLHNARYDFNKLIKKLPELQKYVKENKYGDISIDFASNEAVLSLNKALLKYFYQIDWFIPKEYLCPPVSGRADYIHYIADLLSSSNEGVIPKGATIKALDIGVGANCIYPILGNRSYGWEFIGSEIDTLSCENARNIINANVLLKDTIIIIQQISKKHIFKNIIKKDDKLDFTMCNPPFHKSKEEAKIGSLRKIQNLSKGHNKKLSLNFGGQHNELCYKGGEVEFISKMIKESALYKKNCLWFTALVSKKDNLNTIYKKLEKYTPKQIKTIEMTQGQKQTRFIAWTFYSKDEQVNWYKNKKNEL